MLVKIFPIQPSKDKTMDNVVKFVFGAGSSLIYVVSAFFFLYIQPEWEVYTYIKYSFLVLSLFLVAQGLQVQLMRGQDESKGMIDIILSVVVLIALILIAVFVNDKTSIWWDLWIGYMFGAMYDLIINNRQILAKFRMSTGISIET